MDTEEYDRRARLLLEAGRLDPTWGRTVWNAETPEDLERLVQEAEERVGEAAREGY